MANYHTKLYNEPVNESLLVVYLSAEYGNQWEDHLRTDSNAELSKVVQTHLRREERSCPADSYDEFCQGADWRL
jgi:hypothetical protein